MTAQEKMPLPEDITGEIEEVASGWEAAVKAVMHTQVAMDQSDGVPGWIGESADAYTGSIKKLGEHARNLGDSFAPAASALRSWESSLKTMITTTIPGFWERYEAALEEYNRGIAILLDEVNAARDRGETYPSEAEHQRRTGLAGILKKTWDGIVAEYKVAMDGLDTEAQETANKIQGALDSIIDPTKQDSRDAIGASLFDDIPVVDGQAEWENAQRIASQIAGAMNDPDLTPEDIKTFHEKYSDMLSNPFVANALAERVSPQQMTEFSLRVATAGQSTGLADDINRGVGSAIVLATGGMNLDQANTHNQLSFEAAKNGLLNEHGKNLQEQTHDFAENLKRAGRTIYNPWEISASSSPYNTPVGGYDILSQLIGEAGQNNPNLALGPSFFDAPEDGRSIAQDLVAWDAERRSREPNAYAETFATSMFGGGNKMCDPMHAMYTLMDRPEALDLNEDIDPTLKAADRARLDSVQKFLDSNIPTGMVDENHDSLIDDNDRSVNMTRYLTGGRLSPSALSEYFGFRDGGEQFGKVIQQASMPEQFDPDNHDEWHPRDKKATSIAANFMFGYQDGLDLHHELNDSAFHRNDDTIDGQDIFGYRNPRLRSWAGLIMGPHVEGITASFSQDSSHNGTTGGAIDNHWIAMTSEMRHHLTGKNGFFTDLAFDNPAVNDNGTPSNPNDDYYEGGRAPAIDNLLMRTQHEYSQALREAAAGRGNLSLKDVSDRWTPLLETLFTSPADATDQAKDALTARNEHWQKLLKAGIGAVPFGSFIKDEAANYFINQCNSNGTAPALDTLLPTQEADPKDLVSKEELVKEYMTDAYYQEISMSGNFSEAATSPEEYCKFLRAEDRFVRESDGSLMTYSEMPEEARSHFKTYIGEMGGTLRYSGDLKDIEDAINRSISAHSKSRILTKEP